LSLVVTLLPSQVEGEAITGVKLPLPAGFALTDTPNVVSRLGGVWDESVLDTVILAYETPVISSGRDSISLNLVTPTAPGDFTFAPSVQINGQSGRWAGVEPLATGDLDLRLLAPHQAVMSVFPGVMLENNQFQPDLIVVIQNSASVGAEAITLVKINLPPPIEPSALAISAVTPKATLSGGTAALIALPEPDESTTIRITLDSSTALAPGDSVVLTVPMALFVSPIGSPVSPTITASVGAAGVPMSQAQGAETVRVGRVTMSVKGDPVLPGDSFFVDYTVANLSDSGLVEVEIADVSLGLPDAALISPASLTLTDVSVATTVIVNSADSLGFSTSQILNSGDAIIAQVSGLMTTTTSEDKIAFGDGVVTGQIFDPTSQGGKRPFVINTRITQRVTITDEVVSHATLSANAVRFPDATVVVSYQGRESSWKVDVYSLEGDRVNRFTDADALGGREVIWDGSNSDGQPVAGGIYVVHVSDARRSTLYRVAVIR
jgi:hypothetical protein